MTLSLPPFDPSRPMSAMRNFLYSGDRYLRGDPFPAPGVEVPERKLKQLYETRFITFTGEETRRQIDFRGPQGKAVAERSTSAEGVELPTTKPEASPQEKLAAEQEEAAEKLERKHSHAELLRMASGLAGARKSAKKIELARLLVRSGRAGDGGDS